MKSASWGTFSNNHTIGLCVGRPFNQQPASVGNGTMVALNTHSFEHIQQLYELAISLGARDEGTPGHRPGATGQGFHSAYVRDPDGNKLAFVYYADEVEHQTDSFRVVYESGDAPDIVRE